MNFPTIAIIFTLFFCAAWAGTSTSRPRKAQSSNLAWSKERDPSSARFSDDVAAGIAYMNETRSPNFTKFRDTAGTSGGGGGEMHKIDALSKAWNTKPPANEDAMNSVWAAGLEVLGF
uniref:SCP domain-containing protein n=1 Tax=Globodera pallida TaxID=36090 RepID=A0A183C6Z3_GLOPA